MDSRSEILEVLEGVYGRRSGRTLADTDLTNDDKRFIEQHFALVRRKPFTKTSCGQCYVDALIEMLIYLRKNELMEKSNYLLKKGVVAQSATNPKVYTNSNLTDKAAEAFLKENPKRIGLFEVYPADWETRIGKKESAPKPPKAESKPKAPAKPKAAKEGAAPKPAEVPEPEVPETEAQDPAQILE